MELAVLCQSHVFLAFVDNETGKLVTFNSHSYGELQGLFSKTPLHLREQYKTGDVGFVLNQYDKLFGGDGPETLSKNGAKPLRIKTEEDQEQPYLMDSSDNSHRPKKKRQAKNAAKKEKQNARAARSKYLMPPQPQYSFVDSRSPSQIENSEEVDYEDDFEDVRSRGMPMGREEVKRRASVKEERAPINAIINVFEHKRGREEEEDEEDDEQEEENRGGGGALNHSRKLKQKLKIQDLNLGEVGGLGNPQQKEANRHPHQYFKQQSFKFRDGGVSVRDNMHNDEPQQQQSVMQQQTTMQSEPQQQSSNIMGPPQQPLPPQLMNNQALYQHLQSMGTPQTGYQPVVPQQPMTSYKDYSPYPMLMTPSPFPRFLMGGAGQPSSSGIGGMGLDLANPGLFQTTSPLYPYSGLIHTPGELSKSFSGHGAFKVNQPSPIGGQSQLPSAISNIAQASSGLAVDRMRRGSEFSFFTHDDARKQTENGPMRAMDWYQELLRYDPLQNQQTPQHNDKAKVQESPRDQQLKFQQDSGKKE